MKELWQIKNSQKMSVTTEWLSSKWRWTLNFFVKNQWGWNKPDRNIHLLSSPVSYQYLLYFHFYITPLKKWIKGRICYLDDCDFRSSYYSLIYTQIPLQNTARHRLPLGPEFVLDIPSPTWSKLNMHRLARSRHLSQTYQNKLKENSKLFSSFKR